MKNNIILLAFLLLCGCNNPVREIKKEISNGHYDFLLPSISLINSTIEFSMYSTIENYWYRDSINNVVVNKLQKLIDLIGSFEYCDHSMMKAKINLISVAESSKLIDDSSMTVILPQLKNGIIKMDSIIGARYFKTLPEMIFQMERNAIGLEEVSIEQFKEIRTHTIQSVEDRLMADIYWKDDVWKDMLISDIMISFSNKYPINSSYKYISDNRKYSGVLLAFFEAPNEGYCNYENIEFGGCNYGYIFISSDDKVFYKHECYYESIANVNIGEVIERKGGSLTYLLNKRYSHPVPGYYDENPVPLEKLVNKGMLRDYEQRDIRKSNLLPSECSQYAFIDKVYETTNVVEIASLDNYNHFIKYLESIKALDEFFDKSLTESESTVSSCDQEESKFIRLQNDNECFFVYDRNAGINVPQKETAKNFNNFANDNNGLFKGDYYTWAQAMADTNSDGSQMCSSGWRLPTKDEMVIMSISMQFSDGTVYLADKLGNKCYFPTSGHDKGPSNGNGNYWSSTEDFGGSALASYLIVHDSASGVDSHYKDKGYSVRCVKAATP